MNIGLSLMVEFIFAKETWYLKENINKLQYGTYTVQKLDSSKDYICEVFRTRPILSRLLEDIGGL